MVRLFGGWCGWGWGFVPVVAAGSLLGVDVDRWDPFGKAVSGDADLPSGMVSGAVVGRAYQGRVGQGGRSSVGPGDQVVYLAPVRRDIAGGEGAAAVAQGHRAAQR